MHVPRLRALVFGAILVLPLGAIAAPLATTLHELVEQAWARSPTARGVTARQGEIDATRDAADRWIAGQPALGLSQRSGRRSAHDAMRESEVTMSAPFWTPGQRLARRQLAQYAALDLQAQQRKTRLELAGEVRMRLWDAIAAQTQLEEKEGHLHHIEDLADEVRRRVAAGDLARVDALLAQQEVQAARMAIEQARAEAGASLSRLRILTGPIGALPLDPEPLTTIAPVPDLRLVAARASEQRAQASLRLAQASRSAPPTVSLSMRHERASAATGPERSVGLALQVPLGSAGRNRVVEAEAETLLAVASAEAQQADAVAQAELEQLRLQLGHAEAALTAARARVASMREHLLLIEKAFRLGERGLADLLRSRTLTHEAQVAQRQQEVALGRAQAQFNQASGVLP